MTGQGAQQRRFACAIGTEQSGDACGWDIEVDAVQHLQRSVSGTQSADRDLDGHQAALHADWTSAKPPAATIRPTASTEIRSATCSTKSRSCSTSSTQTP